ncbi:MAG: TPM domain-containing protein [Verrucomicrobiota bacterium]
MNCPFCENPTFEGIKSCSDCGFSLDLLDRIYGAVPRLTPDLCDNAQIFDPNQIKRLQSALTRFHKNFPQSYFHIVTENLTAMENLRAYAFWLFNRAGLSSDLKRGAGNHDVLLTVDAANKRATLIIGYGLEPFVNQDHLQYALSAGSTSLANEEYFEGCSKIIAQLVDTLINIASDIDQTYGIRTADVIAEHNKKDTSPLAATPKSPY